MASERVIVTSVSVPLGREEAFALLCDTSRYAEWVEDTLEVTRTDGPAEQGSTYDEVNRMAGPIKGRSRWRVTEHEPPIRSLHEGEGLPLAARMSVEFEARAVSDDSTEVVFTFRYVPALGPLGAVLAKAGLHRQVSAGFSKTAQSFRRVAEAEAASEGAVRRR